MKPFLIDNLSRSLSGKKIVLGVTGSIAACRSYDIVRYLKKCGAEVRVVMTESAEKFITPLSLETLSGQPVRKSLWPAEGETGGTHHIETARWADLFLIAPATANTIAKMALGLADDLLLTELMAFRGPVLVAPAMNPSMYSHPATETHIQTLKGLGMKFLGPVEGVMACGEEGLGRMEEPEELVKNVASEFFGGKNDKKLLVTLGPTQASLDPVRYFSNRSSGKMGAALCWEAVRRGYEVTAICGPVEVDLPSTVTKISVSSSSEMADRTLELWPAMDALLCAAAVLDWDLKKAPQKLKKEGGPPEVKWIPTVDILAEAAKEKQEDQFLLGFAAETEDHLRNGLQKMMNKGCDAVFVNDVSGKDGAFGSDHNSGWWVSEEIYKIEKGTKVDVAQALFSLMEGEVPEEEEENVSEGLTTSSSMEDEEDSEGEETQDVVLN